MKRFHIIITGDVQGVNFRYYSREKAKSLGIKGCVKNIGDGSVEIITEGDEKKVKEFIEWCKKGPSFAHVGKVKVKEEEYKDEFDDFSIKYTFW